MAAEREGEDMTERAWGERCSRPKPVYYHYRHPFDGPGPDNIHTVACSECGWSLYLLEYEDRKGGRLAWWRHAHPPVAIA